MAKILLVEDDNNLRDIYGERLLAEGYEIISASDGEEALQMAAQQKPDLIISDVMMPKISGFDMLDILRQTPETKDVKIIMMTALSQAEDKMRADKLGADKYLVKSQVTLEDVARVVHDLLGDAPAEESAEPEAADAAADSPATEPAVAPTVAAQPVAPAPEPAATAASPATSAEPATDNTATPSDSPSEPAAAEPTFAPAAAPAAPVAPPPVPTDPVIATDNSNDTATPAQNSNDDVNPTSTTLPAVPNNDDLPSDPMPTTTASTNQLDATAGDTTPAAQGTAAQTFAPTQAEEPATTEPEQQAPTSTPTVEPAQTSDTVNPISGMAAGVMSADDAQKQSDSAANTADEEIADVQKQIESFVDQEGEVSEHTEPVKEPSEQDLIHAKNANEDPKVVPAASAPSTQSAPIVPDSEQAAPPVEPNPTIPPIVKPALDTANPEPASNRKKVIQPINDVTTPDIHQLYEKQMAEEAANSNVAAPTQTQAEQPAKPAEQVSPELQEEQVFNPIADSSEKPEEQTPELETVDVSSITGMQEPEEDNSELPIPGQLPSAPANNPVETTSESAVESPEVPADETTLPAATTENPVTPAEATADANANEESQPPQEEKPIDPNDPNNFAL